MKATKANITRLLNACEVRKLPHIFGGYEGWSYYPLPKQFLAIMYDVHASTKDKSDTRMSQLRMIQQHLLEEGIISTIATMNLSFPVLIIGEMPPGYTALEAAQKVEV